MNAGETVPVEPISERELRLGDLSLICIAVAAVGPFLGTLANVTRPVAGMDSGTVSMGFRIFFVMLAFLFGFFGRRSRAGRYGLLGSAVLLSVMLIVTLLLFSRAAVPAVDPVRVAPPGAPPSSPDPSPAR